MEYMDFETGTEVLDWVIPKEWNIRSGWIYGPAPESKKIVDFKDNNLHVIGYSAPANGMLNWKNLRNHVYTCPERPNDIPYITSYYKKRWGFAMSHNQYLELEKDPDAMYTFNIESDLSPGILRVGWNLLKGRGYNPLGNRPKIFLTSYLCHPSMAINELSGPLVLAGIYMKLKELGKLNSDVLFYIGPENIGAVAFLQRIWNLKVKAGYVVNCVGHKIPKSGGRFQSSSAFNPRYVYKHSRQHNSLADRAALHVLRSRCRGYDEFIENIPFFPDGSDERQWCSPGYNFPMGLIMRRMYGKYPEYHTSADNKDLMCFESMVEMVDTYVEVIQTIDADRTYVSTVQEGTPFFSKDPDRDIYGSTMKLNSFHNGGTVRRQMLELINWSDGKHSLLDIAEKTGHSVLDLADTAKLLVKYEYLEPDFLEDE